MRLTSLDAFRGLALAGMILVNNPGSWAHLYAPLRHAEWHGWTPTDLVFPAFLFIVGVAIPLAFDRRRAGGESRGLLLLHVFRRAVTLFALGLVLSGVTNTYINGRGPTGAHWHLITPYVLTVVALTLLWPAEGRIARQGWSAHGLRIFAAIAALLVAVFAFLYFLPDFHASHQRVPGVLQRIAVCYLAASLIVLFFGVPGRLFWTFACLVGYWAIVRYVSPPADFQPMLEGPGARLHEWIDIHVFGTHLYRHRPDPEGLLSTLPAIATTLLGVLTGNWLRRDRDPLEKVAGLFLAGAAAIFIGLVLSHWIPINKKIWSESFVLFTGGVSMYILACCYLLIDLEGYRRWAVPFLVLGTNAIAVFVLSGLTGWLLGLAWTLRDGGTFSVKGWTQQELIGLSSWIGPCEASFVFALGFVLFWMVAFAPLYRARVFIRV